MKQHYIELYAINLALEEALNLSSDRLQNNDKYVSHFPVTELHVIHKKSGEFNLFFLQLTYSH
jgi:hypothetical protein